MNQSTAEFVNNNLLLSLSESNRQKVYLSDWISIGQDRVDLFAECTDDHSWIHVDVDRSAREGPYGGVVAHGALPLALLLPLQRDSGVIPRNVSNVLVSGIERLRFMAPVAVGTRIRVRTEILSVFVASESKVKMWTRNWLEPDNKPQPVMVGDVELTLES